MNVQQIRDDFENHAHTGYVAYGLSMTDGHYAPEPKSSTVQKLHRAVPVTADFFRYGTDFEPTAEELAAYNATFEVGTGWKPSHLDLAVRWEKGWKTYAVTGTRHAYYLLRKLAPRDGFQGARLQDWLIDSNGYAHENVITLSEDDVLGSDSYGKYGSLLDRSNSHYDLERDDKDA